MPVLLTQSKSSDEIEQSYMSPINKLDQGGSLVRGCRVRKSSTQLAEEQCESHHLMTGYTSQGLPFSLVIGCAQADSERINQFFAKEIVPMMDVYAVRLRKRPDAKQVIYELMQQVALKRTSYATQHSKYRFTLSATMVYDRNGQMNAAGFGVGDAGLVLSEEKTENIRQLVFRTSVNNQLDFYNSETLRKMSDLKLRGDIFHCSLQRGDKLIAYASLQDREELAHQVVAASKVKKFQLRCKHLDKNKVLDDLCRKMPPAPTKKKKSKITSMLSQITVPTEECQYEMAQEIFHRQCAALEKVVQAMAQGDCRVHAQGLLDEIHKQYSQWLNEPTKSIQFLIERSQVLAATHDILLGDVSSFKVAEYKALGEKYTRESSIAARVMGALMVVLGVAMLAAVAVFAPAIFLTVNPMSVAAGAISGAVILAGIGLFASRRVSAVSRHMDGVANGVQAVELKSALCGGGVR